MAYYDSATLKLCLGTWFDTMDEEDGSLPNAVIVEFGGGEVDLDPPNELVTTMREEWGWNPWQYVTSERHYFANASSISTEVVISVVPVLHEAIVSGAASLAAQYILNRILTLVRIPTDRSRKPTLESASEAAKWTLLRHAGVAEPDLRQISAELQDDGSYLILIRDVRKKDDYAVVVDSRSVVGFSNLKAVETFVERRRKEVQS